MSSVALLVWMLYALCRHLPCHEVLSYGCPPQILRSIPQECLVFQDPEYLWWCLQQNVKEISITNHLSTSGNCHIYGTLSNCKFNIYNKKSSIVTSHCMILTQVTFPGDLTWHWIQNDLTWLSLKPKCMNWLSSQFFKGFGLQRQSLYSTELSLLCVGNILK